MVVKDYTFRSVKAKYVKWIMQPTENISVH